MSEVKIVRKTFKVARQKARVSAVKAFFHRWYEIAKSLVPVAVRDKRMAAKLHGEVTI